MNDIYGVLGQEINDIGLVTLEDDKLSPHFSTMNVENNFKIARELNVNPNDLLVNKASLENRDNESYLTQAIISDKEMLQQVYLEKNYYANAILSKTNATVEADSVPFITTMVMYMNPSEALTKEAIELQEEFNKASTEGFVGDMWQKFKDFVSKIVNWIKGLFSSDKKTKIEDSIKEIEELVSKKTGLIKFSKSALDKIVKEAAYLSLGKRVIKEKVHNDKMIDNAKFAHDECVEAIKTLRKMDTYTENDFKGKLFTFKPTKDFGVIKPSDKVSMPIKFSHNKEVTMLESDKHIKEVFKINNFDPIFVLLLDNAFMKDLGSLSKEFSDDAYGKDLVSLLEDSVKDTDPKDKDKIKNAKKKVTIATGIFVFGETIEKSLLNILNIIKNDIK